MNRGACSSMDTWIAPAHIRERSCLSLKGLGTRDNLNKLSGDRGLAGLVVLELEGIEDVLGIAGGIVHSSHLGGNLGGGVLQEGTEDDDSEVELSKGLKHLGALILGLEGEERVLVAALGDELEGGHIHGLWHLGHRGDEGVEQDLGGLGVGLQDLLSDASSDREVGGDLAENLGHDGG